MSEVERNQQNLGYYTVTSSHVTCQIDKPEAACLGFDIGKNAEFFHFFRF